MNVSGAGGYDPGSVAESQGVQILGQDILATLTDKAKGGQHKGKLKGSEGQNAERATDTGKPTSVSILESKGDVEDVFERFADKMAQTQLGQAQTKTTQALQAKMNMTLEEYFKSEGSDKSEDFVSIGAAAIVSQDGVIKPKKGRESLADFQSSIEGQSEMFEHQQDLPENRAALQVKQQMATGAPTLAQSKELLKNYLSAFSEALINQTPQKKQEVQKLKQALEKLNVPVKVVQNLEGKAQTFIRNDIKKNLKQEFTRMALLYSKNMTAEMLENGSKYDKFRELGKKYGLLDDKESEMSDFKKEAKEELQTVVASELDQSIVQTKLATTSTQELIKAFNQFNELSGIVGFDGNAYMRKLGKKMEDLGLTYFMNPTPPGALDTQSQGRGKQSQGQSSESSGEGMDIMEEDLRTLFMVQCIKRDVKSVFSTRYRIYKLKSAMKKSGKYTDEKVKKLQEEGEALAKLKLMALLKESFEERATLSSLRGPAFELVKKKLKMALGGLKMLGVKLSKETINGIRDQVNKTVFTIVKEEYIKVEVYLQADSKNVHWIQKRKEYLAILIRLKQESRITEEIQPQQFRNIHLSSEVKIVEAA